MVKKKKKVTRQFEQSLSAAISSRCAKPERINKKILRFRDDIENASYVEDCTMTRTRTTFNIVVV